jgi:VCBS repeat-containing protein
VTDAAGEFASCFDVDYDTVEIGNHHPIADPGGPYQALPDSCITLDATGSSDPDPGDSITYAWDLDGDGQYDDGSEATIEFCVGPGLGTAYDICLRVTDSFGLTDIACTTVTVVANIAPVAANDVYGTDEDTALNVPAVGVLANDTDANLDPLTAVLVTGPSHGTLTLNSDGSFTYVPDADWTGTDSFTYTANDGTVDSNVATVTIAVGGAVPPVPELSTMILFGIGLLTLGGVAVMMKRKWSAA